ncbi:MULTISPECIES: alpha/beta fold hydrolase [unclassified Streptomyces]|uniref:alpha/beta fold hydrolase n=1 Tax=unclassified Streptomyces TaxID=2593676 RepID=UPI00202F754E|nr:MULTISPECIES: alpha/beta fold hydrolase [unclassified Streptomyces]MCM1973009.1 alpha/beta fold hydrolase [Streptomyces sp. G1]MCX5126992.1 alpha/beta fold hydrolase [Streptomyces sp. NBC_00347]
MRRYAALACATVLATAVLPAATANAVQGPRDIVLVHGMNDGPGAWNGMVDMLKAEGYSEDQIHRFAYDTNYGSRVADVAQDFDAYIEKELGGRDFDVVAHSLGSVISRYWMSDHPVEAKRVVNWISLAGPNHGTMSAYWWGDIAGAFWKKFVWDLEPGSDALVKANNHQQYNWWGETGNGPTRFTTFRSGCDEGIAGVPLDQAVMMDSEDFDSTSLGGAINYKVTETDQEFAGHCPSHPGFPGDSEVQKKVYETLADGGQGGRDYRLKIDKVRMFDETGDGGIKGNDDRFGYIRVNSGGGGSDNLSNVYWRNDRGDTDDSGNAWLNVPNSRFNRGTWTDCTNGRCGIDVMIVDEDLGSVVDPDDVEVNGSIVWDVRHDGTGQHSKVVQGLYGKAEVFYTVEHR